jgi:hypothetical protein
MVHVHTLQSSLPAKRGPKPIKEWPTVLAAWLIKVACDDPDRLRGNVNALVRAAQDFLEEQIGYAPLDTGPVRAKIVELLQFVRR